jgi:hypothetical protein
LVALQKTLNFVLPTRTISRYSVFSLAVARRLVKDKEPETDFFNIVAKSVHFAGFKKEADADFDPCADESAAPFEDAA